MKKIIFENSKFVRACFSFEDSLDLDALPEIAFAGKSNVGKSSLLGKILGSNKKVKISSQPGKTRSLVYFSISDLFYLVDLPGIGFAKVSLEEQNKMSRLLQNYISGSKNLKKIYYIKDARRKWDPQEMDNLDFFADHIPFVLLLNKTDKLKKQEIQKLKSYHSKALGIKEKDIILCSALKNTGIDDIKKNIVRTIID